MSESIARPPTAAIVGGGPAGLMAAEVLNNAGVQVDVYDAMPSLSRKFLLAGKGGLNLTHTDPPARFLSRYGARAGSIEPLLRAFGAEQLREWVHGLGVETFVGTSGRVFPIEMKAAPLLRAWLSRLRAAGVRIHVRHRWIGWDANGALRFTMPNGDASVVADAVVLAMGGGSWPRLGSDGAWVPLLRQRRVDVAPLQPANCGFDVAWSEHFRTRFDGVPVKSVAAMVLQPGGSGLRERGEFVITATGIEGGLIYAFSRELRDAITANGEATLALDLAPDRDLQKLTEALARPRGSRSMANHLRSGAGIEGVKAGLLREFASDAFADPRSLASAIKQLELKVALPRPIDEAISSAGGVLFESLDDRLMCRSLPGIFCAGEMLDWEAPTGGYLLTACFASGRAAGLGATGWLQRRTS